MSYTLFFVDGRNWLKLCQKLYIKVGSGSGAEFLFCTWVSLLGSLAIIGEEVKYNMGL